MTRRSLILSVVVGLVAGVLLFAQIDPSLVIPPDANWGTGPNFFDYTGDENFSGYAGFYEDSPAGGASFSCHAIPFAREVQYQSDFRVNSWWQWVSTCLSGGVYVMKSTSSYDGPPTYNTVGQDFSIYNPFTGSKQAWRIDYLQCQFPIVKVGIDTDGPCGPTE